MLFGILGLISVVSAVYDVAREKADASLPDAVDWDAIHEDFARGVPYKEIRKKRKHGGYYKRRKYPEPARYEDGSIYIQNWELWEKDIREHGCAFAGVWAERGRYNLPPKAAEEAAEKAKRVTNERLERAAAGYEWKPLALYLKRERRLAEMERQLFDKRRLFEERRLFEGRQLFGERRLFEGETRWYV